MKSLVLAVVIVFSIISGVLIWCLFTLSERIDNLEDLKIDSYQESTRMRFDKVHAMNMKLIRQQEEHDKKIEVLRLRLDKLIEKEKRLTFDSTDPGYHRELLKALTELKDIKDREKKLNEEIEEILQTGDL
jgi:regulatory protein YycH of two-component signal transduction system YycFG